MYVTIDYSYNLIGRVVKRKSVVYSLNSMLNESWICNTVNEKIPRRQEKVKMSICNLLKVYPKLFKSESNTFH